jgi:hypothetical protein
MSECGICKDPLPADSNCFAKCSSCETQLHFECADIQESTWIRLGEKRRGREEWKCKACSSRGKSAKPKEVSVQELISKMQNEIISKMEKTIKQQFSEFESRNKNQLDEFKTSLEFFSNKIDDYEESVNDFKKVVRTVETSNKQLMTENAILKKDLNNCKTELELLQQYNRNRNVQVDGVPEVDGEQMRSVVEIIAKTIGESIDFENDVQAVHRVPTKRNTGPKPIVLQFTNRQKRDAFLKKSKLALKQRGIKSTDFARDVPVTNVYVNEHLTPYFKNLLFHAKKLRETGFKYVWVSEGKIFVKKTENDSKIRISSTDDLVKLGLNLGQGKV